MLQEAYAPLPPSRALVPLSAGRPTKFRDEYCEQVERLCRMGATDKDIARYFDVSVRTVYLWKLQHPEFLQAIKTGKVEADTTVAASLFKKAQWTEYDEAHPIKVKEVQYENGKRVREFERIEIVMVRKVLPADTTAAIFWLKNRQPEHWRDASKVEHDHTLTVRHENMLDRVRRLEIEGKL